MKSSKSRFLQINSIAIFLSVLIVSPNGVLSQNYDTGLDLPPGFTEYDLGENTVAYFEEMMPRVEDEDVEMRIEEVLGRMMQGISLRDGVDEIVVHLVESDEIGAWALPGGFVLITTAFYNLCSTDTDDELAVVLGHEIAHINEGHVNNPLEGRLQENFKGYVEELGLELGYDFNDEYSDESAERMVNMITKQKELDADKQGILYTTLAGYDPRASFSVIDKAVESGEGVHHPSKEVRLAKLEDRLGTFIDDAEKFHAGVMYYLRGNLDFAEKSFKGFLQSFPSREVYNNLGVIYYQKALKKLPLEHVTAMKSLKIDTQTMADKIVLRGGDGYKKYKRLLKKALKRFKSAIDRDSEYAIGMFNLACVCDDLGEYDQARIYLKKAEQLGFDKNMCQNTLASILINEGKWEESKAILTTLPSSPEVNFNLGVIAKNENGDFSGHFESFLNSSGSQSVFTDFASQYVKGWTPSGTGAGTAFSYDCEKSKISVGMSREEVSETLGDPRKEITILSYEDIYLWSYPEQSMKIYFMGENVESFIISDVSGCPEVEGLGDSGTGNQLNPGLPQYVFRSGNIVAHSNGQLTSFGKYDNN